MRRVEDLWKFRPGVTNEPSWRATASHTPANTRSSRVITVVTTALITLCPSWYWADQPHRRPIGTVVWKPEDAYPVANGTPPDLIALFGDLAWRSVGSVGLGTIHTFENDTGPDDANHAWNGILVMAGHGIEAKGAIQGAEVRDVARTVMRLFDLDPPEEMGGKALV